MVGVSIFGGYPHPTVGRHLPKSEAEIAACEFAALDAMIRETHPRPGDTRTCPDCGKPQHYTGLEFGWCHDASA